MRRRSGKYRRDSFSESSLYRTAKVLAIPAVTFGIAIWLAAGLFDESPLIGEPASPEPSAAAEFDTTVSDPSQGLATEAVLDAAVAAALSDDSRVRTRTVISHHGLLVGITKRLPDDADMFGRFVNVRLAMRPTPDGARVTRMAIGRYEIPANWVTAALNLYKTWLPASGDVMTLLSRIETIDPDQRVVTFRSPVNAGGQG